jgi:hypothetical protein
LRKQRLQQLVQSIDDGIHETAENQDDGASGNKEILMNAVADSVARSGVTSIHLIPEESIITDIIGIIEEAFTESKGNDVGTESSAENSNSAPLADAKQEQRMSFENEAQEETANDSEINLKIECSVNKEESESSHTFSNTECRTINSIFSATRAPQIPTNPNGASSSNILKRVVWILVLVFCVWTT